MVERIESPDGQRLVIIDRARNAVWMARRLPEVEADEVVAAIIPRWLAEANRRSRRPPLELIEGGGS